MPADRTTSFEADAVYCFPPEVNSTPVAVSPDFVFEKTILVAYGSNGQILR